MEEEEVERMEVPEVQVQVEAGVDLEEGLVETEVCLLFLFFKLRNSAVHAYSPIFYYLLFYYFMHIQCFL